MTFTMSYVVARTQRCDGHFQVNLDGWNLARCPLIFFLHLFQRKPSGNRRTIFTGGRNALLSRNPQRQSTERNCLAWSVDSCAYSNFVEVSHRVFLSTWHGKEYILLTSI